MNRYTLYQAVDETAAGYPEAEAVRFSSRSISYGDLSRYSWNLANVLVDQGIRRGDRVGIYMNKGLESAAAIYGIMKAGGAYVPLDPLAPLSRIGYVINDCGIEILITKPEKLDAVKEISLNAPGLRCLVGIESQPDLQVSCISWDEVYDTPARQLNLNITEQDLAYILYTSGSTGLPKGIMHTHRSGLSFAEWGAHTYGLTRQDRLSNHAPLHFDLSTFDYFSSAIAGATTVIVPEAYTKFPANMAKFIQEEQITVWYSVPFALIQLLQHGKIETRDLHRLRWVLFAGEVFPTKHLRQLMKLLPEVSFSNLYGPTETNVCTYYHVRDIPDDTDETIPIGAPCANIEDLVVDLDGNEVSQGEVGELLIRGGVVMKGYWGQPERNNSCFYRRPAFGQFEDIFYKTGDLVMRSGDGNYLYFGRKDRQVKTRGYRVELDEVEVVLLSHPEVEEAAVYTVPDGQGSNLIEAAVILRQGSSATEGELLDHIGKKLPTYAVPVCINFVMDFPRTSTGKINRRELQGGNNGS
jgi:amino acid adenylation domain-containing protein